MTRVRGGIITRRKHKKIKDQTKGYYGSRNHLYKRAADAVKKAGEAAFAGRRQKRKDLRRLWITRINAGLKKYEVSYSKFINMMKKKNITLDRKILSELATNSMDAFKKIVEEVKK